MDIRIGNDIKMILTLKGPNDFDRSNIKQVRCYLTNTTLEDDCCCDGRCPIERRFPREPFPQYYMPTPYTLHNCGKPMYHVPPCNSKCAYASFGGCFTDYHWWPGYNGFGTTPCKFSGCCGCGPKPGPSDYPMPPGLEFSYLAPSVIAEGENKIETYFPAQDQRMCGTYKLVVVLVIYESGWGKNNLHTYTIDYGDVFTLVDTGEGASGNVTIDVDTNTLEGYNVVQMNLDSDAIYVQSGGAIRVNTEDYMGHRYAIRVKFENGLQKTYDPDNWQYGGFVFTSSDPSLVFVQPNGTITVAEVEDDIQTATVTVCPDGIPTMRRTFEVNVVPHVEGYIGFTNTDALQDLDFADLGEGLNIYGTHIVTNTETGNYLWVCSTTEVSDIDVMLFDVPMEYAGQKDGYYCYYCPNALVPFTFDITIR